MVIGFYPSMAWRTNYEELSSAGVRIFCPVSGMSHHNYGSSWVAAAQKHRAVYCDDRTWDGSWWDAVQGMSLDYLVVPEVLDAKAWRKRWGKKIDKQGYLVENPIIVPCATPDAIVNLDDSYDVLLDSVWGLDEFTPWHCTGLNVWLAGKYFDTLWQRFCEVSVAGAVVRGIIIWDWYSYLKNGYAYPRRPYGAEEKCDDFASALRQTTKNLRGFWGALANARGM